MYNKRSLLYTFNEGLRRGFNGNSARVLFGFVFTNVTCFVFNFVLTNDLKRLIGIKIMTMESLLEAPPPKSIAIRIGDIFNGGEFYVVPERTRENVGKIAEIESGLRRKMSEVKNNPKRRKISIDEVEEWIEKDSRAIIAVNAANGDWVRGRLIKVIRHGNDEAQADVFLLDGGRVVRVRIPDDISEPIQGA